MDELEITNIVDATEKGVRALFATHAPKVVSEIATIVIEGRTARVTFLRAGQAKLAIGLNGKTQAKGKRLTATVVSAPVTHAPKLPKPTKVEPAPVVVRPARTARVVRPGADRRQPAPYHFVPIEPSVAVTDAPVFHDTLDLANAWTGELDCTLTALTPLLVANEQYPATMAKPELAERLRRLLRGRTKPFDKEIDLTKKKILEPLTLPAANGVGPVLLPGSGLKGMLRGAMQSLLSAPMERVAERTASYRPHFPIPGSDPIRECVPALVIEANGFDSARVLVLESLLRVYYVRPELVRFLPRHVAGLTDLTPQSRADHYRTAQSRKAITLTKPQCDDLNALAKTSSGHIVRELAPGKRPSDRIRVQPGFVPVVNLNGIDLFARLNRLFHDQHDELTDDLETKSREGYPFLLLDVDKAKETPLDFPVLRAFADSLRHLADDTHGHLRDHPQLHSDEGKSEVEGIKRDLYGFVDRGLMPGDILFLERDTSGNIDGVGHHAYARRRYRDSVHKSALADHRASHAPTDAQGLRDVLCPRPVEFEGADSPTKLTGARLMFGYVGTTDGKYHDNQPLSFGIGKGDFAQLAGRVAINHAIEFQQHTNWHPIGRFLNPNDDCLVPLRPVGSPKSSAVEHYLTQDRLGHRDDGGILCTWGDTPDDDSAGNLRGRKAYLHQPDAETNPNCYELRDKGQKDWMIGTEPAILSEHSAVARFVSRPRTKFRFKVRFVNLRLWELGALVFALSPTLARLERLASKFPAESRKRLDDWLTFVRSKDWANKPELLAQKLGHGRPLGMGSVLVECDRLKRLGDEGMSDAKAETAIDAFGEFLVQSGIDLERWVKQVLVPWLQVRRYLGRSVFDYPRERKAKKEELPQRGPKVKTKVSPVSDEETAFNYHSNIRGEHAKLRKTAPADVVDLRGLSELDDLDQ